MRFYDSAGFTGTTSFTYSDPHGAVSNVATITLAVGVPMLSVADVTVGEADGTATVTISVDIAPSSDVTVDYATSDGTATGTDDYTATAGTATIPAGALATTVSIPIIGDSIQEPDETFTVTLSNPTGGAVVSATAGSATVTIIDDGPLAPRPVFDPSVHVELVNSADGFAVNWTSVDEEDGHVEWALSAADLVSSPNVATDGRGGLASRLNERTHRVAVSGVAGGSTIHFNIVSGGLTDPKGPYQVTIPSVALTSLPNLLTGVVRYPNSTLGLQCIVSMRVTNIDPLGTGVDHHSMWVTGITTGGGYTLDITNMRGNPANAFFNNNVDQPFSYLPSAATSEITVKAQCDPDNVGQTVKTTLDAGFTGYQNFDVQLAPLSPTFSIADVSVGEGTGAATLTISLQPAATASTAVSWATSDGTATAPVDYTASSGTVLFAAEVTSKAVNVPVTDDAVDEPDETFSVTLSNPTGANIGVDTAAVTIVDDDGPPAPQPLFDPSVHVELLNSADGIAVNWTSAGEEDGRVEWALSAAGLVSSPNVATDDRGSFAARLNKRTHRVKITGVAGGSTIHYNIVSGGVRDPDGPYQVTIPSVALTSPPNLLTGIVRYPDSSLGLECIVSMRVTNKEPFGPGSADAHSLWVTGITNGGGYTLDITNIRGNPANAFFNTTSTSRSRTCLAPPRPRLPSRPSTTPTTSVRP